MDRHHGDRHYYPIFASVSTLNRGLPIAVSTGEHDRLVSGVAVTPEGRHAISASGTTRSRSGTSAPALSNRP